nr:PREDICTED: lipoma HMGIC fusion partner-like 3 protein [Latimeria chalumnae]|eukprot:XP_014351630.1 PREDICTED: lipoma HMGIC fusion partner-like 3 protein [Latimeria chalumnae]
MLASQEVAKLYQTEFIRNARAVGVLWAVCTLCFAIIEVVVLIQPAWVRTSELAYQVPVAPSAFTKQQRPPANVRDSGYFGLFEVCVETDWAPECQGSPAKLIPIPAFKTAAVFVCMSLALVLTTIGCFVLFRFCNAATVYKICAWLQLTAASCLALGCLTFPGGWHTWEVRVLCGLQAGSYRLGDCSLHWAYILAILGVLDSLILATLAFVLGNRQDALLPDGFILEKKGSNA